jgi:hypothetical protein
MRLAGDSPETAKPFDPFIGHRAIDVQKKIREPEG